MSFIIFSHFLRTEFCFYWGSFSKISFDINIPINTLKKLSILY